MTLRTLCPNERCGAIFVVQESVVGRTAVCKLCGKAFVISAMQAAPRQAAPGPLDNQVTNSPKPSAQPAAFDAGAVGARALAEKSKALNPAAPQTNESVDRAAATSASTVSSSDQAREPNVPGVSDTGILFVRDYSPRRSLWKLVQRPYSVLSSASFVELQEMESGRTYTIGSANVHLICEEPRFLTLSANPKEKLLLVVERDMELVCLRPLKEVNFTRDACMRMFPGCKSFKASQSGKFFVQAVGGSFCVLGASFVAMMAWALLKFANDARPLLLLGGAFGVVAVAGTSMFAAGKLLARMAIRRLAKTAYDPMDIDSRLDYFVPRYAGLFHVLALILTLATIVIMLVKESAALVPPFKSSGDSGSALNLLWVALVFAAALLQVAVSMAAIGGIGVIGAALAALFPAILRTGFYSRVVPQYSRRKAAAEIAILTLASLGVSLWYAVPILNRLFPKAWRFNARAWEREHQ